MGIATAAIAATAGLNAAGQIYSADRAADATRAASRSANALQRYMYDTTRADQAPWRNIGVDALGQLSQLYGFNGQPANFDAFTASPDYQFALQQGQNQLDRQAAARGGLYSGQQLKAAQQFGQGLASQQFGNYFNRLSNLAGLGQTATNQIGYAGQNYANQAGQNYLTAANAQASSYGNMANALSGFGRDLAYGYGRGWGSPASGGGSFGLNGGDYAGPWGG